MAAKKTRGRQKIEMKKIENENDRMIAFSKRRSGIYKKASELATLTGAEIGIVVFSPSGKPFSFGYPSLEAVANRFLGLNQEHPNDNTRLLVEAHRRVRISELNQQHNELLRRLDEENAREKILKQNRKGKETQPHWWETPVNEINHQELLQMDAAVDDLHKTFLAKLNEKTAAASSSMAPPMYFHHK
ncbi:Agamous-like MADS-box protein AGL61 [Citrus sinensis]|uniref:Agamous-like MADS-box protein AGL61 n=1 Tax=Citrus sinensis TaxID=2711 RepID=A0ACB8HX05_CITSI|nr:Agamous-like MADS-box protein AGL61 [Citrus sinensis]